MLKRQNGQGMLEYIVILAAVLMAVILFAAPGGPLRRTMRNNVLDPTVNELGQAITKVNIQ